MEERVEKVLAVIDGERKKHSVTSELFFVLTKVREEIRAELGTRGDDR